MLSVAIARAGTVSDVAQFAIGFAGFVTITGLARAMVGDPSSVRLLDSKKLQQGGRQVSFYGLFYSIFTILLGLILGQPYLIAAGIFGHSISMYDYSKFVSTVFGQPHLAVIQEFSKCILIVGAISIPQLRNDPLYLFLGWLVITALVGYGGVFYQRIYLAPSWRKREIPIRESLSYAMDYALGSGITQITTFTLGTVASPSVNASVRGAGTIFGPITLVASSIRTLVLPFLARRIKHGRDLNPAANLSFSLLIVTLPLVILINFIPDNLGTALLGETWFFTKDVLPILSVEVITSMLTTIPFAGHRTLGAHRRILILRGFLAIVRLVVIVSAALIGGHILAAYAMVFTSSLGLFCWWISYRGLMNKTT